MQVEVTYGSRLGSTQGMAEHMAQRLRAAGLEVRVDAADKLDDLPAADAYIIGSGVYGQHWMKQATDLVKRSKAALAARPVWLFSVGPLGQWATSDNPVEPKEIPGFRRTIRPLDHRVFAGAFDRASIAGSDLSRVERIVSGKFLTQGDFRDWPAVDSWTDGIARRLLHA